MNYSLSVPFESTENPTKYAGFYGFRVGTCEGLWRVTQEAYEILTIVNRKKHNGHFQQALKWFERSAERDGRMVRVCETWNLRLAWKLRKHGYKRRGLFTWEKII